MDVDIGAEKIKFDAIFTVGDNLYPINENAPTDEEFDKILGLFKKPHI